MPPAPDLRKTQEIFWELITAPEGVEPGSRQMASEGRLPSEDLGFLINGDERLGPSARLDIYANMYFYRLRDCLAEDYPKMVAVTGGARFHNLVTDYLLEHPSSFWSLRNVGGRLCEFAAGHPVSEEFPFIADLARLEWARVDVFDEEDAEVLTREALGATPQRKMQDRRLHLVPALRLLELSWNVAPIWLEIEEKDDDTERSRITSAAVCRSAAWTAREPAEIAPPARAASRLRVWRHEFRVFHRSVARDEMACLRSLARGGATLPALCEVILGRLEEPPAAAAAGVRQEAAAHRMAGLLDLWLREGLLRAF